MPELLNTNKNNQKADYTICSLCGGRGMVSVTNGISIKCPACSNINSHINELYETTAKEMAKAADVIIPDESIKVVSKEQILKTKQVDGEPMTFEIVRKNIASETDGICELTKSATKETKLKRRPRGSQDGGWKKVYGRKK